MIIKFIVFDFDGTIADTHQVFVGILNRLATEFGYAPVSEEQVEQLRGLSSREIVRQANISIFKIPFLLRKAKEEFGKEIINIKPIEGIEKALKELDNQSYNLAILTSNFQENVESFLVENNLRYLFRSIYSGTTIFGKDKMIKQFLKQHHLPPEAMIYVGDETRDVDAAKKSKVPVIAVTWGFNSATVLAQHHPDFIANCPDELVEILNHLSLRQVPELI